MSNDTVYTPTVIAEIPFPEDVVTPLTPGNGNGDVVTPQVTPETPLPQQIIAHETIGTSLNTKSRKILAQFSFLNQGAIQIGTYQNGVSGDIRISPTGIIGRDVSGITTFAIDADTGDATFKGILQAGTLIAGDDAVIIDESSNGNGRIVLFNNGIPSILIGDPD